MSTAVEVQPAGITIHTFSVKHIDNNVALQVWKLADSFYLWISTGPEMRNLAVAMNTRYVSCVADLVYMIFKLGQCPAVSSGDLVV